MNKDQNILLDENKQGEATLTDEKPQKEIGKLYLESYGCQMNFSDSEIVASIMSKEGYSST
ncbi:MAG: tRNA (N6-isopentenyl adenosine(37)-C2)-methylthiotransferase MiaB, partial [Flavobacteriales bacterium]